MASQLRVRFQRKSLSYRYAFRCFPTNVATGTSEGLLTWRLAAFRRIIVRKENTLSAVAKADKNAL